MHVTGFCDLQHTMLQLIKEAGCHNGLTPCDDSPVTEVLNQVCPSTWRGACKTAVQLLFGQAGLVSDYGWRRIDKQYKDYFKKTIFGPEYLFCWRKTEII